MKILAKLVSCIALSCLATTLTQASEWRGIRPLYSKRPDVERILGKADDPSKEHSLVYKTEKEVVIIDYADGLLCKAGSSTAWRVPRGTVVSITVSPRTPLPLSELHIDEKRYTKTLDLKRSDVVRYNNEEDGVGIVVYQGKVQYINYFPSKKDEHLRCSREHDMLNSRKNIFVYPAFDSYQSLSFEEEKARLDNFALHLREQVGMLGYIIVYAGDRQNVSKARARATRARNYLVTKHGVEARRIVTKYGGRRERFTVELAMASPQYAPKN
jgi:hypothetical protein